MAARSIASLTISFGLVSIPVKLFSATEASKAISFNLLHKTCGSRLKQQYLCVKEEIPVAREEMVKGYEFTKDQYVMFTPEELKAMEEAGTHTADITEFVPVESVDPIYFDKAYYLAPDKGGAKPYALLARAAREPGVRAGGVGRPDLLRQSLFPRARQGRGKAVCAPRARAARVRPLRARPMRRARQAIHRADPADRKKRLPRPRDAAASLRRRGALDHGDRHPEDRGEGRRAQARAAADRAAGLGVVRPGRIQGRGARPHRGCDPEEGRRPGDHAGRGARARRRPGDRPHGSAARESREEAGAQGRAREKGRACESSSRKEGSKEVRSTGECTTMGSMGCGRWRSSCGCRAAPSAPWSKPASSLPHAARARRGGSRSRISSSCAPRRPSSRPRCRPSASRARCGSFGAICPTPCRSRVSPSARSPTRSWSRRAPAAGRPNRASTLSRSRATRPTARSA